MQSTVDSAGDCTSHNGVGAGVGAGVGLGVGLELGADVGEGVGGQVCSGAAGASSRTLDHESRTFAEDRRCRIDERNLTASRQ